MSYSVEAYREGQDDAVRDILAERLIVEIFVGPWPGDNGANILKERYGIELKIVGTDLVDAWSRDHAAGYNEVMRAAIERRFGVGVLEKAASEAEANWKPPPPPPAWKTLVTVVGLPFLLCAYCVLWLVIELPEELRTCIERDQKSR